MIWKLAELFALALSSICLGLTIYAFVSGFPVAALTILGAAYASLFAAYCFNE